MGIPSEFDLQLAYNLSKGEARIYRMKLDGMRPSEIAEFNRISVQTVKNKLGEIKHKIEVRNHPMDIVTVNRTQGSVHKALVQMAFRVLAKDQGIPGMHEGKYSIVLNDVKPDLGDKDFIIREVFKEVNILISNESEAQRTADIVYEKYLQKGGERGKMGYGWVLWLFNKYYIMYDIY